MIDAYVQKLNAKFNLVLILAILLVGCFIYFGIESKVNSKKLEKIQNEIEKIDKSIVKIDVANAKIDGKMIGFENQIIEIDKKIENNDKKIDIIIKDGKSKKDSFRNYNATMYEVFFTERYKERRQKEHGSN